VMGAMLVLSQSVDLNPNPNKLPGGGVLESLTDGIAGFGLIFCLIGLVIGAALWGLGSTSSNYQQAFAGKRTFATSAVAALLIGGAAAIINFFYGAGQNI
jgi:Family of unknown function (DUF6112)